jgi:hypothetical protein
MCCTQGCRNCQLCWLLIAILFYELNRTGNDIEINDVGLYTCVGGLVIFFGSMVHWLITRAYLKVAQSAKEDFEQAREGKGLLWLYKMDIVALIYTSVNAFEYITSVGIANSLESINQELKSASELNTFLLQSVFMAIWGFSLFDLYKQIKKSDRITPEKGVFIVHGVLLILYLTFDLAIIVTTMFSANYCSRQSSDHYCGTS